MGFVRRKKEALWGERVSVWEKIKGGAQGEVGGGLQGSLFPIDYVYFENSSSNPYLVRRIEELNKVWGCPSSTPPPP